MVVLYEDTLLRDGVTGGLHTPNKIVQECMKKQQFNNPLHF